MTPLHPGRLGIQVGGSLVTALAAYYVLYLDTELWLAVFPPDGPRWVLWPSVAQQRASLCILYAIVGLLGRLWARGPGLVVAPGVLGFAYGLPSDGGRWYHWGCHNWLGLDTRAWQLPFEMGWASAILYAAVGLSLLVGWYGADRAIALTRHMKSPAG